MSKASFVIPQPSSKEDIWLFMAIWFLQRISFSFIIQHLKFTTQHFSSLPQFSPYQETIPWVCIVRI